MDFFFYKKHSTIKNKNTWANDFNGLVFFSCGASNSCSVLIAFFGKISFVLNKQKIDKAGKILILDFMLDGDHYIVINLYNANNETEQSVTYPVFFWADRLHLEVPPPLLVTIFKPCSSRCSKNALPGCACS